MDEEPQWLNVQKTSKDWIEHHWCCRCRLITKQRIVARNAWASKFLALCLKDGNQLNEVS